MEGQLTTLRLFVRLSVHLCVHVVYVLRDRVINSLLLFLSFCSAHVSVDLTGVVRVMLD